MTFGGKSKSILKQVKEAFNADRSKHRATRAVLAATKHNSKTIEKLNKLLLKKTKKLERARASKRIKYLSESSSSYTPRSSRRSRTRSSDSSSDDEELAMMMMMQDQINKNAATAAATATNTTGRVNAAALPVYPNIMPDPYNFHNYNMDPYATHENETDNLLRKLEAQNRTHTTEYTDLLRQLNLEKTRARPTAPRSVYGNAYGNAYGNSNVHMYFDVRRKYNTYGAVRLTPTQRSQVSDYINRFAQYLVQKGIIHRVVSSASNYNTHDFQIHINMPNENKNKLKLNLGFYRRSATYHPSLLDTYEVEITSVS